uniref:NADH-ubiquinone oxidoreductase chain 2 n=1 Tax=Gordionus alpestris TaxID=1137640 RepID=A0A514ABX3_9BILA|nr:NADH dehydrogenase subunit 2 [Gordionus alpestris]QDH52415.1 NADH dehydrogenase subunit 2 [Gordionus alpestris]
MLRVMWLGSIMWMFSSNSFIYFWQGLALNLVLFLLFVILGEGLESYVGLLLYYLVQSTASLLFLILSQTSYVWVPILLSSLFMMKAGLAPMHNWFVSSSKMSGWQFFVPMSTLQKLIPVYYCTIWYKELPASYFWSWDKPVMVCLGLSALISSLAPIYTSSFMMIMVYSSIGMSVWMVLLVSSGVFYFLLFSGMYIFLIFSVKNLKMMVLSVVNLKANYLLMYKVMGVSTLMILLFSVSGFPPSNIFLMKLVGVISLINNHAMMVVMLLLLSGVGYYYYYRMIMVWSIYLMLNLMPKIFNKKVKGVYDSKVSMLLLILSYFLLVLY